MYLSGFLKNTVALLCISAAVFTFSSCNKKTNREIILIPEGYSGFVSVIHGVEEGGTEVQEEGKTIVNVGNNGVALTRKQHWDNISIENEFYYVDASGKRTKITEISDKKEYKGGTAIMNTGYSNSTVNKPDGSFASGPNVEGSVAIAHYVLFVNDTTIYSDMVNHTPMEVKHDSIVDQVVKNSKAIKRE